MEYSEIIYLISQRTEEDEIGNNTSSFVSSKKCYAKKQSVRTNEYYNAVAAGKNPSIEFVIKRLNYNGEDELEWNNTKYSIVRTVDPKNKFDIVLVCSKKIGVK
ncbi:MAG: phage head closure protein [Tenericutes bacterium]|nr:phage head closure protein [Mycoplasmatota bacterium]